MSKSIMALIALGLATLVSACAQEEEVIMVEPEPIMEEETMTKF